jgi:predicted esterase
VAFFNVKKSCENQYFSLYFFIMKHLFLVLGICCGISCYSQVYPIGHTTATFTDPSRNNRSIPVEIYYPALSAGDNVAMAQGNFGLIAFGHGFVMEWSAYSNVWQNLVPQGFVMIFPKTEGSFSPSHSEFAADLSFSLVRMLELNQTTGSSFYQNLSGNTALMGHSMGAGAAVLAAAGSQVANAIVTLAAAETNPSAIEASAMVQIPMLAFAGANDCVTAPSAHQIPIYEASVSQCKTYVSIIGGSHCQMAQSNFYCNFGESTCTPTATISRAQQHAVLNTYLGNWLKRSLNNDCSAGASFDQTIAGDAGVTFDRNCLQCESLNVAVHDAMYKLYPNPVGDRLFVTGTGLIVIEIFDLGGRRLQKATGYSELQVDTSALAAGSYAYRVKTSLQTEAGKLLKK